MLRRGGGSLPFLTVATLLRISQLVNQSPLCCFHLIVPQEKKCSGAMLISIISTTSDIYNTASSSESSWAVVCLACFPGTLRDGCRGRKQSIRNSLRSGGGAGLCILLHKCTLTTGGLHLSAAVENNLGELEVCRGLDNRAQSASARLRCNKQGSHLWR